MSADRPLKFVDAINVSVLLDWLLNEAVEPPLSRRVPPPTEAAACEAAAALAARVNETLGGGLTPREVRDAWSACPPRPSTRPCPPWEEPEPGHEPRASRAAAPSQARPESLPEPKRREGR